MVCVVFSKDRPLQLDATLRSLKLNCDDPGRLAIRVLCATSRPYFSALYRVLAYEHKEVVFKREKRFKPDLVGLVEGSAHVMFLVDDTLVVNPLSLARTNQVLDEDPACLGFSLRLGRNTTHCYSRDKPQRLPAFEELGSGLLKFDWTEAEHDFGYPIEVSSSIYRTSQILPMLMELEYRNPNTLESALARHAESFRGTRPRLACHARSVAFSVPANLVQTAWKNRVDSNPALTAEALADAYSRGQRLDVEQYRGFIANACHQELEFFFVKRSDVPTVSVVIPCYDQASFLGEAVESVLAQTFTDWEIVIVDDGSPDDTATVAHDLIARNLDHRIRLVRQANAGLARARNAGIEVARGRYILPLDADDMLDPRMLAATVEVLETRPDIAIAYTDETIFGSVDRILRLGEFEPFTLPAKNGFAYCSLYRREVWEAVGGYNPNMRWGYEDWDFWVGAIERGYVPQRISEPLFLYRFRPGTMYAAARTHDPELRRQMRTNHPRSYRPWLRLARWWVLLSRRIRRAPAKVWRNLKRATG